MTFVGRARALPDDPRQVRKHLASQVKLKSQQFVALLSTPSVATDSETEQQAWLSTSLHWTTSALW